MALDVADLLDRALKDVYAPATLVQTVVARHARRRFRRRVAAGVGAAILAGAASSLVWVALDSAQQAAPATVVPAVPPASPEPSQPPVPSADGVLIPAAQRSAAPALAGKLTNGRVLAVDLRRGLVMGRPAITVVNFCGTWSPACREEQRAFAALGSVPEGGPMIVGVDEGDTPASLRAYLEQFHVTYPVILDSGALAKAWQPTSPLPVTAVVDSEGRIAARFVGPVTHDQLFEVLKLLTAEQTPAVTKLPPVPKVPFSPQASPDRIPAVKIAPLQSP